MEEYKGLLWHKVKISLIDIQRAWGHYNRKHVRIYRMAKEGAGEEEIMEALNTSKQTISRVLNLRIYRLEDNLLPEDRREEIKYELIPEETYAREEEERRVFEIIRDGVLNETEKRFINLFLQGYSKKEIARKSGKSPSWATYTFKTIVRKIRKKLELESPDCGNSSTRRKRKKYHKRGR